MLIAPAGVKVHLAMGYTDMRRGMEGLAMMVQKTLEKDAFSGHLFVFRGRQANLVKILFWDGSGLCLFTKRLHHGRFTWPRLQEATATVTMSAAQLGMLLEGIDWHAPDRVWRPASAG